MTVDLPSIYRNVQTAVFFPQKAKAVPNMIFVVFYVASFISLTTGTRRLDPPFPQSWISLNYFFIKHVFVRLIFQRFDEKWLSEFSFYTEYMSIVHKYLLWTLSTLLFVEPKDLTININIFQFDFVLFALNLY